MRRLALAPTTTIISCRVCGVQPNTTMECCPSQHVQTLLHSRFGSTFYLWFGGGSEKLVYVAVNNHAGRNRTTTQ